MRGQLTERSTVVRLVSCAVLFAASAQPAVPQALAVEEVLQAPTLAAYSPPSFSPDNRFLAYVVTDNSRRRAATDRDELLRSGLGWQGIAADIWITDLVTGAKRNLTRASGHNWNPQWSPDGRHLAFLADRSNGPGLGPARLWIWERASGELRQISDADVREGFREIEWAGDDPSILTSLFPEAFSRDEYVARITGRASAARVGATNGSSARIFEFDPTSPAAMPSTDLVNLDLWRRDLGLIDVQTGKLRRVVHGVRIGHYALSPDRRQIVYSVLQGAEKPGIDQYLYDVIVQNLSTGRTRLIASKVRLNLVGLPFAWTHASDRIAWRSGGPLSQDEIHLAAVAGGPSRRLDGSPRTENLALLVDESPPVWDAVGRNVFFTRNGALWRAPADGSHATAFAKSAGIELQIIAPRQQRLVSPDKGHSIFMLSTRPKDKRVGFAGVDLRSGAVSPLFEESKRYGGYEVEPTISPDGSRIAYVAEDQLHAPDVFVLGGDFREPRKASEVAPGLAQHRFGKAQVIDWRSTDGDTLHGALIFPADYQAKTAYPLIVKVYGGSSISDDLNRFGYASAAVENLQLFATRGYALLLADSKLNVGTPMADLVKSVMPGIDKAVELGVADPERIGIMGHSYGGYSTLALIAQSRRFKAAVMRAGMGDLIGGYGQLMPDGSNPGIAWSESGQGRMGGSPWELRERYIENSPVFHLDRVSTPVLIIHGERDDAVPVFLADQIFTGLRRLGRPVTYVRYEGESHWEGQWSYVNQVDVLNRVIAWFDRHLKGNSR